MVKNLPANAGDASSIPGWGRSPGGGNGNLLQYSCLENPLDRGAWRATVHGVAKSWTPLRVSTNTRTNTNKELSLGRQLLSGFYKAIQQTLFKGNKQQELSSLNFFFLV